MKTNLDEPCSNYKFEFHPDLDRILMKISKHLYSKESRPFDLYDSTKGNDSVNYLAHALQIRKNKKVLLEFIGSLSKPEKVSLIRMIFLDPKFFALKNDGWNYYGDYVRDWPNQLTDILIFSNIKWDKKKRTLVCGDKNAPIKNKSRTEFIALKNKDRFYRTLKDEINKAYDLNLPNAVLVLSRKLVENLLIDLLRSKFKTEIDIYYDKSRKQFQDLSVLISNLSKKKSSFLVDERDIERLAPHLNKLRVKANASAHSITEITNMDDINGYEIPEIIEASERLKSHNEKGK